MAVHTIDLAYVGRGIHEELVAYVADQEGYYEDEGVHVAIRDGVGWEMERVRRGATIGLGRALLSRLTDGIGWKMLSVNTHRPLFWFLGTADVTSMADLRGRRLAVHAGHTAPGCFARIVLRKHGLNPDRDLECVVRAPGDYPRWRYGTGPAVPRHRRGRAPAQRRRRLLDAGLDLLGASEQDPAELTVRAICGKAALGVRYFYESFTDKDDFVGAVFDSVIADLAATTRRRSRRRRRKSRPARAWPTSCAPSLPTSGWVDCCSAWSCPTR